jgi:hypothetical protein
MGSTKAVSDNKLVNGTEAAFVPAMISPPLPWTRQRAVEWTEFSC